MDASEKHVELDTIETECAAVKRSQPAHECQKVRFFEHSSGNVLKDKSCFDMPITYLLQGKSCFTKLSTYIKILTKVPPPPPL
jgi:hypothetical protein